MNARVCFFNIFYIPLLFGVGGGSGNDGGGCKGRGARIGCANLCTHAVTSGYKFISYSVFMFTLLLFFFEKFGWIEVVFRIFFFFSQRGGVFRSLVRTLYALPLQDLLRRPTKTHVQTDLARSNIITRCARGQSTWTRCCTKTWRAARAQHIKHSPPFICSYSFFSCAFYLLLGFIFFSYLLLRRPFSSILAIARHVLFSALHASAVFTGMDLSFRIFVSVCGLLL